MVISRPLTRKLPTDLWHLPVVRSLPTSKAHGLATSHALYAVGATQLLVGGLYAVLASTTPFHGFLPTMNVLFWVPFFIALLGVALTVIGHLGSLSAPWLAALINLPLALTALYVDGVLASTALVLVLLGSAGWLVRGLLHDSAARQAATDDFSPAGPTRRRGCGFCRI